MQHIQDQGRSKGPKVRDLLNVEGVKKHIIHQ